MEIREANQRLADVLKRTFPELSYQQALDKFGEIISAVEVYVKRYYPTAYEGLQSEFAMAYSVIDSTTPTTFWAMDMLTTYSFLQDFLNKIGKRLAIPQV